MNNRWIINRAGLINFWYYDEEEFKFSEGRLLLRGSNGSGKSVTMQSFIPLLLDGNKSPERLDPFGSKARKLENYLLGEDGNEKEENTAYLYMEFKKEESGNYLTIGMGFKAQRSKPLQSWGFAITDGRRIGKDFFLYKETDEKIPLSKKELENRLGSGGKLTETQGDYMRLVNSLLFGYEEIEEYDELIKLLVQLRTPKLSKDFKPTVVYEIMENSLQQLSEEDLRPMSEAIENMDNIKSRLEELKESKKAADKIKDAYDKYNRFMLLDKAKSFIGVHSGYEDLLKEKRILEEKRDRAKEDFEEAEGKIEELEIQRRAAEEKKKQLEIHDSIKIKERLVELEENLKELRENKNENEKRLNLKKVRERQLYSDIRVQKGEEEAGIKAIRSRLQEMDDLSTEFDFDEQLFMSEELIKDIGCRYDFSYIKNRFRNHQRTLERARDAIVSMERKNLEYDRALQELEGVRSQKTNGEKKVNEAKQLLTETKEELIERIYTWKRGNKELIPSEDTLISLSRAVNNFNQNSSFDEVTSILRQDFNLLEGELNREIAGLKFEEDNLKKSMEELQKEIREWKNKKDPEPDREEKVLKNRKRLDSENIPYIPFYRAVDFKDEIGEETRGRIEESLLDMGLLDAIIVPKEYRDMVLKMDRDMADRYIFPSPNFLSHNLGEFLKSESIEVKGITPADIDNALMSILIEDGTTYLKENGEYGIGVLRGKTSSTYTPRFIGASARKRFREEMIESLTEKLVEIEEELKVKSMERENLLQRLNTLRNEFNAFPRDEDLKTAISTLRDAEYNLRKILEELNRREQEEKRLYGELKEIQQKVLELTNKINLKPSLEVYNEAIEASKEYWEMLFELDNLHQILLRCLENIKRLEEEKEGLEVDIEGLSFEIGVRERKIREFEMMQSSLEEQLKLTNYKEIEEEIDECLRLLREIPPLLLQEADRKGKQESIYNSMVDSIEKLGRELTLKERILQIYREAFIEEYSLGYVELPEMKDPVKAANLVIREIRLDDKNNREDYINKLFERFQENSQYLREYILKIESVFERESEEEEPLVKEAISKSKRLTITGKVRGKDVDFLSLLEFIKEGIEENEGLLRESDRQLFEDILVKNISKKIRARIYHSEQWVKKMNELMENMNTSSGLSFSLRWTSKKAESEGQLDTRELVELLKQEGGLMKEADLNKLSQHFRSKIEEARRIQEDMGKSQSFHSIIRDILDYRKWFEFKLYFTKTGQAKKELTNNTFYQFSGGEKAMAMYVPLFSAVYARYEGARKDCPRLISLDEAFAGVDEKNIRDMFRLLKELNLDFIINSQILWGDYDTVPSLAISELIRPDNADFVTVIRYHWNGRVKELVM